MGQPIETPEIPHDDDCPRCVPPVGSRWAVGETPLYVWCTFTGIVDCGRGHHPPPNGEIFRLTQQTPNVCLWSLQGSIWHVNWWPDKIIPFKSRLRLADHDGWSMFTDDQQACPPELQPYVNDQLNCIPMYGGSEGFATIWWNPELIKLAYGFGLNPGPDLRYELRESAGDFDVHKFCDRHQRTNIRFKV